MRTRVEDAIVKDVTESGPVLEFQTPIVERINSSFLAHNPYAKYVTDSTPSELQHVMAILAVAYELSQIKYHLSRGNRNGNR